MFRQYRHRISQWAWSVLARFIADRPYLVNYLISLSKDTPYYHIGDYMHRWWLMPKWSLVKDQYGVWRPKAWCPFSIRIHHIKRPDKGRAYHDHPWDYRTVVLRNWYDECDVFGRSHIRAQGATVANRAQVFHRIAAVPAAGVWTLFISGPRINSWGYLVGGRKVHHSLYEEQP